MNGWILTILASLGALVGGWAAFKGRKHLNLALGFTAGLILGLVAFELLPEIYNVTQSQGLDPKWPMLALVAGFLFIHIIEKTVLMHSGQEKKYGPHSHPAVGTVSALALSGHSFLDGMSIGLAFQVNTTVGTAVAIAVIGHRFADGFNTTNVMLRHQHEASRAKQMLLLASVMPLLGLLTTYLFSPSPSFLAVYLGFFAGFLLYIGASDILPQAHSKKSSGRIIVLTIIGALFMLAISHIA
jgi:ZIP family zinc transporter